MTKLRQGTCDVNSAVQFADVVVWMSKLEHIHSLQMPTACNQ